MGRQTAGGRASSAHQVQQRAAHNHELRLGIYSDNDGINPIFYSCWLQLAVCWYREGKHTRLEVGHLHTLRVHHQLEQGHWGDGFSTPRLCYTSTW